LFVCTFGPGVFFQCGVDHHVCFVGLFSSQINPNQHNQNGGNLLSARKPLIQPANLPSPKSKKTVVVILCFFSPCISDQRGVVTPPASCKLGSCGTLRKGFPNLVLPCEFLFSPLVPLLFESNCEKKNPQPHQRND
jgi:hypothetical protein